MTYELQPKYDSRKSFYGKATVREHYPFPNYQVKQLLSYDTIVATIHVDTNEVNVYGIYSNTTLRHIKEFLKQHGFKADSKAQIIKDYMGGE